MATDFVELLDEGGVRLHHALEAEHRDGALRLDAQLERGLDLGVSGVPGYVMGGSYLLPGAQDTETMQAIIQRAKIRFSSV